MKHGSLAAFEKIQERNSVSKRKLLLADDSITIQKVVNLTFADEGIEVISVGDGNSAMDKIREESPDLIMADVNMPGLNGYEICEKVRQSDEYRRTPVILLVGSFEPFDEVEAKRVGADDFLKKPFQSINQLVNTVTVLLDSESAAAYGEDPADDNTDSDDDDEFYGMTTATEGFADSGIDDEMIETSHSVPADAAAGSDHEITEEYVGEDSYQETAAEDHEDDDFEEFSIVSSNAPSEIAGYDDVSNEPASDETDYAFDGEESFDTDLSDHDSEEERSEDNETEKSIEVTGLDLDESNLLELPFEETEVADDPESVANEEFAASLLTNEIDLPGISVDQSEEDTPEDSITDGKEEYREEAEFGGSGVETKDDGEYAFSEDMPSEETGEQAEHDTNGIAEGSDSITQEMIDEISRRVVERLSGEALRDVAREVVPEMAERIIRQIAEEKMNE
ncbi:MAG: response regulator [Pyrinomonadaceae bacterium]